MNKRTSFFSRQVAKRVRGVLEFLWFPVFCAKGKKPFTFGYQYYKQREIVKSVKRCAGRDDGLPHGYGYRLDERIVEYRWLFRRLPAGGGRLLDAGSSLNYRYLLKREPLASKKITITTLFPEAFCYWYDNISYTFEDLRDTCFRADCFDYIVSISTIEHIGLDNTMLYTTDMKKKENRQSDYLLAVREWHRLLKPGGTLYVTFPFGRHSNHGWFQIFDASMLDGLVQTFTPRRWAASYFKYEPEGWKTATPEALADATYFDIQKNKVHDSDFAAASRGVACLELTK